MKKKKVVLAFSGGLDTTFCAVWLKKELNCEVYALTVNTGGFVEDEIQSLESKAMLLGVDSFRVEDATTNFYDDSVRYLIFGNVLKNNTYPLSVSAERSCQAVAIARYALEIGADAIAHGSTGAGNDQVRFDLVFSILAPKVEIITPIRDMKLTRQAEISYLEQHNIQLNFSKNNYSVNKGLWGTSIGGKETLGSRYPLPEEAWPSQQIENEPKTICLHFQKGELTGIENKMFTHPVEAIRKLEQLASPYAIGRDTHVGDTIIGIKGRVGFEAAAAIIILKAHHLLEKHTLSKYQMMIKDQLSVWYGNWLHEALFLDPVMRDIERLLENSQMTVNGKVYITLYPYRFTLDGIESENDLMSAHFASYGELNNAWSATDVKGYSKILGNALKIYHTINAEKE
jgi:argininosuccinate synthase